MKVFERWRVVKTDEEFRSVLDDEEVLYLAEELFGGAVLSDAFAWARALRPER